tara:strand:- start:828 stop:989 length:162 start_codon:yes stop_codon:yes gene_type:complete
MAVVMGVTATAAERAAGTVGKRVAERAEARLVEMVVMVAMVVGEARGAAPTVG